jgi:hypothetical protein
MSEKISEKRMAGLIGVDTIGIVEAMGPPTGNVAERIADCGVAAA